MACNTKHGPAAAIRYYENATGVKLTQEDWHLIREAAEADKGGKLSRARITEHEAATAFMELAEATNTDQRVPSYDVEDACAEFVRAGNTTGTVEMLRHLSRKGLPQTVTSRTRRGKAKSPKMASEGIVGSVVSQCPACGQFSAEGHICPPEALRQYAVAEDTQSAEWFEEHFVARQKRGFTAEHLHYLNGEERHYGSGGRKYYSNTIELTLSELEGKVALAEETGEHWIPSLGGKTRSRVSVLDARSYLQDYATQTTEIDRLGALLSAADERYERFEWNRAFLVVTNGTGHVHKSMGCSTCYPTTRFNWRPEYSGADEEHIVSEAGERACTVCYPTAPVDVLSRPSKIFSEEERQRVTDRDARRVALAEKKAKQALKAATADGSELVVVTERGITSQHSRNPGQPYERKTGFKTEQAAYNWMTERLDYAQWPNPNNEGKVKGLSEEEGEAIKVIIASIANKHGVSTETIQAELDRKLAARLKRSR